MPVQPLEPPGLQQPSPGGDWMWNVDSGSELDYDQIKEEKHEAGTETVADSGMYAPDDIGVKTGGFCGRDEK